MRHLSSFLTFSLLLVIPRLAEATCNDPCSLTVVREDCSEFTDRRSISEAENLQVRASCQIVCCAPIGPGGASGDGHSCSSSPATPDPSSFAVASDGEPLDVSFASQQTPCGTLLAAQEKLVPGNYELMKGSTTYLEFEVRADATASNGVDSGSDSSLEGDEAAEGSEATAPESADEDMPAASGASCQFAQRSLSPVRGGFSAALAVALLGFIGARRRAGLRAPSSRSHT